MRNRTHFRFLIFDFRLALALILLAFSLQPSALFAQPVPTYFTNQLLTGVTNDTTFLIKPQNNPVIYNGIWYWYPVGGINVTSSNSVANTNLIPGAYTVAFTNVPKSWSLYVPDNGGTPINASQYSTNLTVFSNVRGLYGSNGIVIIPAPFGFLIISNSNAGGGGGGFNLVLNTNDTKFTFSGNTLLGPTNFDMGGLAAALAQANSNLTYAVSNILSLAQIAGTNNALLLSSNNTTTVSNILSLAQIAGTNNALLLSSNYSAALAQANSNLTYAVSNILSLAQIAGTNNALLLSSNNTTTVSNILSLAQIAGTNNALLLSSNYSAALAQANSNLTYAVSNILSLAQIAGTNNALTLSSNNATVVSNGVMGQVNGKVAIQSGAANSLTMTNAQFADASAQNRQVLVNILLSAGHAGNWRLDTYSNGIFIGSGIEVASNLVQGVGGFTNAAGSLMAFLTDLANGTNAVKNFVLNNYAPSNTPTLFGPVTFFFPASQGLILSNAANEWNIFPATGSPVNELEFQGAGQNTASLILGTNLANSSTNVSTYFETAPIAQANTNLIGIDPAIYQDPNVIVVQSSTGPAWSQYGYFYTNSANTGAGCFTNPVLWSLGYGAILTNVGGQWNFKTNNVLVTSVTGSVTNNAWSGAFSMTTVYGPTVGSIHFSPGLPGSDLVGVITNNTTGNAATATLATNAALATNAILASNIVVGVVLTNPIISSNLAGLDGMVWLTRGTNRLLFATLTNCFNFGWLSGDIITLPAGTNTLWYSDIDAPAGVTIQGKGAWSSFVLINTNGFQLTNNLTLRWFTIIGTNHLANNTSQAETPTNVAPLFLYEGGSATNILIDGVNVFNDYSIARILDGGSVVTGTAQNCYWSNCNNGWMQLNASSNCAMVFDNDTIVGVGATNFTVPECMRMTSGSNIIQNCSLDAINFATNNFECIAVYVASANDNGAQTSVQCTFRNLKHIASTTLGTNGTSNSILVQGTKGQTTYIVLDGGPLSSSDIHFDTTTSVVINDIRGDRNKIGISEMSVLATNGLTLAATNFYKGPPPKFLQFDWTDTNSIGLYNYYFGSIANVVGTNFGLASAGGVTEPLYVSNNFGAAFSIWATNGLRITNYSGSNVLTTSNALDQLLITNVGSTELDTWSIGTYGLSSAFTTVKLIEYVTSQDPNFSTNNSNTRAVYYWPSNLSYMVVFPFGQAQWPVISDIQFINSPQGFRQTQFLLTGISTRTNSYTLRDLPTNGFGLWNSNGLGGTNNIFLSVNSNNVIQNLRLVFGP